MPKKKAEEKINLDSILFKCRDILRAARNLLNKDSSSFADKNEAAKVLDPFIGALVYGIQCSSARDIPCEIDDLPTSDLAEYLLNGEFKKHCDGQHIFDDSVMKTINKDME